MNKKGDERVLGIYFFVILIIIALGIVSGVVTVYGQDIDIREAEVSLLRDQLVDCLVDRGDFNMVKFEDQDMLKLCKLNFEDQTLKYKDGKQQYAVKIDILDINSNLIKSKSFGNEALMIVCGSKGDVPVCLDTIMYLLEGGNPVYVKIKTVVRKNEQNNI